MFHKRVLGIGLAVMLVLFGLINAWPYITRNSRSSTVRLEVIKVTKGDGSDINFSEKASSAGREFAKKLAEMLDLEPLENDMDDIFDESYMAEVMLFNQSDKDLFLLEASYVLNIDELDAAFGQYQRKRALKIPANGSVQAFLPFRLNMTPQRFSNLVERNIHGNVRGEVWLQRKDTKIKIDYRQTMSLSRFEI